MRKHLGIFSLREGELILKGIKKIDLRLSKLKTAPFGLISSGDLVYIKVTGKDIIGQFKVKKVIFYDGLEGELEEIKAKYGSEIGASDSFWEAQKQAKFGTLIFIGESNQLITSPIKISKKDSRGWVVLD